jgi:hypothetical protein
MSDTVQARVPLWLFAAQIAITSVFYTWLVHRSPHSLVPALALHTSFNVTVGIALLTPPPGDLALRPFLGALAVAAMLAGVLTRTGTFRTPGGAAVQRSSPGKDRGARTEHRSSSGSGTLASATVAGVGEDRRVTEERS